MSNCLLLDAFMSDQGSECGVTGPPRARFQNTTRPRWRYRDVVFSAASSADVRVSRPSIRAYLAAASASAQACTLTCTYHTRYGGFSDATMPKVAKDTFVTETASREYITGRKQTPRNWKSVAPCLPGRGRRCQHAEQRGNGTKSTCDAHGSYFGAFGVGCRSCYTWIYAGDNVDRCGNYSSISPSKGL